MAAKKKRKEPHLLSYTRPPSASQRRSLSSQTTRSLIRSHHNLQKQLHAAVRNGDTTLAESLKAQLTASGGLQKYQEASIQGQSAERGGDTSKVLVEWMTDLFPEDAVAGSEGTGKLTMLEVGALKTDNACSRSGIFEMTRIDLHSQHPDIHTQNFMEMPMPSKELLENHGFDIVSLSLVVNYVGDAVARGAMLKRVAGFLRPTARLDGKCKARTPVLPALFLVLPAPCVTNSRYLDEERLGAIMTSLGYAEVRRKLSKKLVYYLWQYESVDSEKGQDVLFKKLEVRAGGQKNNFAIVLQ
ncbi:MAG: hypothetical protein Q9170_003603 [Blastenia crenularia]